MKTKKIINFSIMLFLITVLFLVSLTGCGQNTNNSNNVSSQENQVVSSPDNSNEIQVNLGSYVVQPDEKILDDITDIMGDEDITFSENNKFDAYIGFGNYVSGTYSLSDSNTINCTITSFIGEYSPEQKVDGSMTFKIIDDSTIELVNVSTTTKVQTTNLTDSGWVLSGEYKDLSLRPFEKGIKFVLSK